MRAAAQTLSSGVERFHRPDRARALSGPIRRRLPRDLDRQRRRRDETGGGPAVPLPDPGIDDDAKRVTDAYIVIECQLESQFGDMSIAYEAIGCAVSTSISKQRGHEVRPIQMRPYGSVKEEPVQALKRFSRTTVMIFPRQDLGAGLPVIGADAASVRLVLDGHDSKYFFEWPGVPLGETGPRMPTAEEAKYIGQLGYYVLFTDIRRLAHIFD